MGLKSKLNTLVVSWWLILWWQWDVSSQTQIPSGFYSTISDRKVELVTNFSQEQNLDSLYNVTQRIEQLLFDWNDILIYYWYEWYIEKLKKLEQEYREEVKKIKLNKTIFRCSEKEFDQKIENIKKKIIGNPDNYGKFDSKWNFIIYEWSYEKLLKEEFPEFYNFYNVYNVDMEYLYFQRWNKKMAKYNFKSANYHHSWIKIELTQEFILEISFAVLIGFVMWFIMPLIINE